MQLAQQTPQHGHVLGSGDWTIDELPKGDRMFDALNRLACRRSSSRSRELSFGKPRRYSDLTCHVVPIVHGSGDANDGMVVIEAIERVLTEADQPRAAWVEPHRQTSKLEDSRRRLR